MVCSPEITQGNRFVTSIGMFLGARPYTGYFQRGGQ